MACGLCRKSKPLPAQCLTSIVGRGSSEAFARKSHSGGTWSPTRDSRARVADRVWGHTVAPPLRSRASRTAGLGRLNSAGRITGLVLARAWERGNRQLPRLAGERAMAGLRTPFTLNHRTRQSDCRPCQIRSAITNGLPWKTRAV